MYRFLEYTVGQYMTYPVKTVTRQTTMRELEALFEKHDFNAFPVVEGHEMVGLITKGSPHNRVYFLPTGARG
jgi:CBS domain-containing protein